MKSFMMLLNFFLISFILLKPQVICQKSVNNTFMNLIKKLRLVISQFKYKKLANKQKKDVTQNGIEVNNSHHNPQHNNLRINNSICTTTANRWKITRINWWNLWNQMVSRRLLCISYEVKPTTKPGNVHPHV